MPGVTFMQSAPNSFRTEATSFEDDARFDLHKASETITSAKDYYRILEQQAEVDEKTRMAIAIAAQNGISPDDYDKFVSDGIDQLEQYAQGKHVESGFDRATYEYLHGVDVALGQLQLSKLG